MKKLLKRIASKILSDELFQLNNQLETAESDAKHFQEAYTLQTTRLGELKQLLDHGHQVALSAALFSRIVSELPDANHVFHGVSPRVEKKIIQDRFGSAFEFSFSSVRKLNDKLYKMTVDLRCLKGGMEPMRFEIPAVKTKLVYTATEVDTWLWDVGHSSVSVLSDEGFDMLVHALSAWGDCRNLLMGI